MHNNLVNNMNLERIIDHLEGSILCCKNDDVLTIVYASPSFYSMLGYEHGEVTSLLGEFPNAVLRGDPLDRETFLSELNLSGYAEPELKLIKKDGHHIWVNCRVRLTEENGEGYFCAFLFDITMERRSRKKEQEQMEAVRKAENDLAESETRYRIIMEQAADPIFDYNIKNNQVYCSPSFQARFSFDVSQGNFLQIIRHSDFVFEEDRDKAKKDAMDALRDGCSKTGEYRLKGVDNHYCWYRVRSTVIQSEKGDPIRIIIFFTDIDKQKKETMRLREWAEHDLLTGLYNHVTTTSRIDRAIAESPEGSRHALFVIDIDNFKTINDQLGHLLGDEVIGEIAGKLKEQFREDDIVGKIGGDEFVVFLQNIPSDKLLFLKSRVLNELFRTTHSNGEISCKISCSVGISIYPTDGTNYHELFHKADIAMYAAKNSGKDSCCLYTEGLEQIAHQNETM